LELEPSKGLLISGKMAEVTLTSVIAACRWFMEQKQTNDEATECLRDMGAYIESMLPALLRLNTQGLQDAPGVLENLWQCLDNAKRIYVKYKKGYSIRKIWVTPAAIKEKAEVQTKKVRRAFKDLDHVLNFVLHNHMVEGGMGMGGGRIGAQQVGGRVTGGAGGMQANMGMQTNMGMQANNIARQVRGVCAICRSPVFVDQERMKDQQGSYLHTQCHYNQKESAKRNARELAPAGMHDDDQSRKKQAAVVYDAHEELCEGENVPAQVPVRMSAPPRVHVDSSGEGGVKVYKSYFIKHKCGAKVQDGMVRISGETYTIKNKLRAAGFKWDSSLVAWTRSEAQVSSWINELHVKQGKEAVDASSKAYADAVMTAVTELDETSQACVLQNKGRTKPAVSIKKNKVCVHNAYDIKDRLKELGFRFNSEEKTWELAQDEVLVSSLRAHTLVA